jgi:hypothetical protein
MPARRRHAVAASGQWVDEGGVQLPAGEVHTWQQEPHGDQGTPTPISGPGARLTPDDSAPGF